MNAKLPEAWLEENQRYISSAIAVVRSQLACHVFRAAGQPVPEQEDVQLRTDQNRCEEILKSISPPPAIERLCALFGLSSFERSVLLLCAGMELDAAFAPSCAAAQGDPQRSYPTMGLALAALPQAHWNALLPSAPLRHWRLIEFAQSGGSAGAPLTTRPVRIDERALHYLTGVQYLDERLASLVAPLRSGNRLMPTHQAVVDRIVSAWSRSARQLPMPVIVLYGPDALSARDIAASACGSLAMNLHYLNARALPPISADLYVFMRLWERESSLTSNALLLDCDDSTSEANREGSMSELLERMNGPLMVRSRERLRIKRRSAASFEVCRPRESEQKSAWTNGLQGSAQKLNGQLDRLTSQFSLNLSEIHTATTEASAQDTGIDFDGLWEACRNQTRSQLDDLAQRVESTATWDDLVLPEMEKEILQDIVAQVRHRSTVYEKWGFGGKGNRGLGISSLFAGSSGTGKTMAAEVLARALNLDLYRIDLSSVVSKYIGETEKNLRRVFDAADAGGAILLFDEADALFGKRSEVKDSHDRYANIEVSYLLQRIESYRGLAILTTNMKSALDAAFLRRIRFVVQFPFPDTEQRAQIWSRIFPHDSPTDELDVGRLAQLNVAGGNIKNMALTAAFLAADTNEPIRMTHLLRAARSEYAKLEKSLTEAEVAGWV